MTFVLALLAALWCGVGALDIRRALPPQLEVVESPVGPTPTSLDEYDVTYIPRRGSLELEDNRSSSDNLLLNRKKVPLATLALTLLPISVYCAERSGSSSFEHLSTDLALSFFSWPCGDRRTQFYRLLSHQLLHVNLVHLTSNMTLLLAFGVHLELNVLKSSRKMCFLFQAAVAAGALSNGLWVPYSFARGASGGVWGLVPLIARDMGMNMEEVFSDRRAEAVNSNTTPLRRLVWWLMWATLCVDFAQGVVNITQQEKSILHPPHSGTHILNPAHCGGMMAGAMYALSIDLSEGCRSERNPLRRTKCKDIARVAAQTAIGLYFTLAGCWIFLVDQEGNARPPLGFSMPRRNCSAWHS